MSNRCNIMVFWIKNIDIYIIILLYHDCSLFLAIICICNPMVFSKTKKFATKRTIVMVLGLVIVNSALCYSVVQQIHTHKASKQVKDDHVVTPAIGKITSSDTIEPITEEEEAAPITVYTVAEGDTLSGIADKFNISTNTIRWANDLPQKGTIRVGQKLTILPVKIGRASCRERV